MAFSGISSDVRARCDRLFPPSIFKPAKTRPTINSAIWRTIPPMHQTAALLAAVRMALYPVDVRGQVSLGTGIDISDQHPTMEHPGSRIRWPAPACADYGSVGCARSHERYRARDRRPCFLRNERPKEAMTRSVQQGSSYYTVAYIPLIANGRGSIAKFSEIGVPRRRTDLPARLLSY